MRDDDTISSALKYARGRYVADRAAQLSGVPRSTLYDWRRDSIFVPDFAGASPMAWSYRDLVLLRLLAWLRQLGMPRPQAADEVRQIKDRGSRGEHVRHLRADQTQLVVAPVVSDEVRRFLPFKELDGLFQQFDLAEPIRELAPRRGRRLWAPDLRRPSAHITISPSVVAGEPCLDGTRIPTASIYALHVDRALPSSAIIDLYPGLESEVAEEAILLERRLRGVDLPKPEAA